MADPFESVPATQPTSWPEGILCRCGNPDNCACPPAPERTPPDDTTENLRERLAQIVARWALMYPLGNYGIWGTAGASRDQLAAIAEEIAAAWGRDIADRILAALAGDPGDLPARMTEAVLSHEWDPNLPNTAHGRHSYSAACAVCEGDVRRILEVALSVRWEHAAHLAARVGDAERRAEHAESELSNRDHRQERWAHERARAEAAEAERDRLRARLTGVAIHANRARNCVWPETPVWDALADLFAALEETNDALKAARCPSCDHLAEHHQPEGCWYAVTTGAIDLDLVCPCTVPDTALDGGA